MTHAPTMEYQTAYADTLAPLTAEGLAPEGVAALDRLAAHGIEVVVGLRVADMDDVARIANQQPVREFCPKDARTRVADVPVGEGWMKDGRWVVQAKRGDQTVGYGWVRPEECKELPKAETTFAVRLDESLAGMGLGVAFSHAIVFGGVARVGANKVGFESWAGNVGAFKTYIRGGATSVNAKNGWRETTQEPDAVIKDVPSRRDTRIWWHWPQTFPQDK
jgi:hypothetical protein